MNNISSKLVGLFLIFMGVGYLGGQFDLWSFTIFFRGWWACLIVIVGICSMLENGFNFGNVLITGLGVYFFLAVNDFISFRITFEVVVASVLILVGLKLLFFRNHSFTRYGRDSMGVSDERSGEQKVYVNALFGTRRIISVNALEKCRAESLFGSVFLDLREADLSVLDVLSLECVFGTIEVIVPSDVNLNIRRENFLGNCYADNKQSSEGYSVNVKETCIFGNIRITKAKK